MIYMGVDIGGSTRNGISIIDEDEKLLYSTDIPYKEGTSKGNHRRSVAKVVAKLVVEYNVDCIVIERVKMHRGSRFSKLSSILSLAKATGTLLDNNFDKCKIYDCETVSWKAKILGKMSATKDDAVNYVKLRYGIDASHDLCDSICEALYLKRYLNSPEGKFQDITDR